MLINRVSQRTKIILALMAVACFDPSVCPDNLLTPCYPSDHESPWESGDLAFLDDALPPEPSEAIDVDRQVAATVSTSQASVQTPAETIADICVELRPCTSARLAISAPAVVRRQRDAVMEAQRFVTSCRGSQQPASRLFTLAEQLTLREAELIRAACRRRGPRRRLNRHDHQGTGLSRTTTNDRMRLAWSSLEELFNSERRESTDDFVCPAPCDVRETSLTVEASKVAENLNLDKHLVSGLAMIFSQRQDCLQTLVQNLSLPLNPPGSRTDLESK